MSIMLALSKRALTVLTDIDQNSLSPVGTGFAVRPNLCQVRNVRRRMVRDRHAAYSRGTVMPLRRISGENLSAPTRIVTTFAGSDDALEPAPALRPGPISLSSSTRKPRVTGPSLAHSTAAE